MDKSRRNKLIIIIVAVVVVNIIIIATSFIISRQNDRNMEDAVYISNLDSCSANMEGSLEKIMRTTLYSYIARANEFNKQESLPNYEAIIREGTCVEEELPIFEGEEQMLKHNEAILDIPEAKQSWFIEYTWINNDKEVDLDFGTVVTPSCLPEEDLIYGDFNCDKVLSVEQYGTENFDPILEYMPYDGAGFNLAYDPDAKLVSANIQVRQSDADNQELKDNLKAQVEYWFEFRELDITSYTVEYSYTVYE